MGVNSPAAASPLKVPNPSVAKAKAVTSLNEDISAATSAASSPGVTDDSELDLAEEFNRQIQTKYVKGSVVIGALVYPWTPTNASLGAVLGGGTYATVYAGHERSNPSAKVAIKKIKKTTEFKDGMSMDAIREIKFLQELHHPNIITLHAVFSSKDTNLNLVLELLPGGDLQRICIVEKGKEPINYGLADIKAWFGMMCRGIWFCHENFVLHRDIKCQNLLIGADGELKIADFGLARAFADPGVPMTSLVVTNFYRPPELFMEATHYSAAVDIWSMAIVLGEMVKRTYWIPGTTDIEVFTKLKATFGDPLEQNWPGVSGLSKFVKPADPPNPGMSDVQWEREFGLLGKEGIDLLKCMTTLDPRKRPTAKQILEHEFFKVMPKPTSKERLPRAGGGEKVTAEDLKRKPGDVETGGNGRGDKVARKLDFSAMKK